MGVFESSNPKFLSHGTFQLSNFINFTLGQPPDVFMDLTHHLSWTDEATHFFNHLTHLKDLPYEN